MDWLEEEIQKKKSKEINSIIIQRFVSDMGVDINNIDYKKRPRLYQNAHKRARSIYLSRTGVKYQGAVKSSIKEMKDFFDWLEKFEW